MTEAAQVRLTYIAGIRDDLLDYAESAKDRLGAALLDAVSQAAAARSFADVPDFQCDDVAARLSRSCNKLHKTFGKQSAI